MTKREQAGECDGSSAEAAGNQHAADLCKNVFMDASLKKLAIIVFMGVSIGLCMPGSVRAHHGGSVFFDMSKTTALHATVTEYRYRNPHLQIFFDAIDQDGELKHWTSEASSPTALRRRGWTPDTLRPGDRITIIGNRAKGGATSMHLRKIILADGTELQALGDPPPF